MHTFHIFTVPVKNTRLQTKSELVTNPQGRVNNLLLLHQTRRHLCWLPGDGGSSSSASAPIWSVRAALDSGPVRGGDVGGTISLLGADDVEFDSFPIADARDGLLGVVPHNRRTVDENLVPGVVTGDEPVRCFYIVPLDGTSDAWPLLLSPSLGC